MIRILRALEESCLCGVERLLPGLGAVLRRRVRLLRYIVSGGTAAAVDLGLLFLLTDTIGFHYLISAALAFLGAFCVSFMLQKLWTFEDAGTGKVRAQAALYFLISGANVFVNLGLMYVLVEFLSVWYFFAQVIAGALIACYSFLLYRAFVFNRSPSYEHTGHNPEGR